MPQQKASRHLASPEIFKLFAYILFMYKHVLTFNLTFALSHFFVYAVSTIRRKGAKITTISNLLKQHRKYDKNDLLHLITSKEIRKTNSYAYITVRQKEKVIPQC